MIAVAIQKCQSSLHVIRDRMIEWQSSLCYVSRSAFSLDQTDVIYITSTEEVFPEHVLLLEDVKSL